MRRFGSLGRNKQEAFERAHARQIAIWQEIAGGICTPNADGRRYEKGLIAGRRPRFSRMRPRTSTLDLARGASGVKLVQLDVPQGRASPAFHNLSYMQASRLTRRMTYAVLALFVVFLAVAGFATSMRAQQDLPDDTICTSEGPMKLHPQNGGASSQHDGHKLKCFLCTGVSTPPSAALVHQPAVAALGHAPLPAISAQLAWLTQPPLPARGPPQLS